MIVVQGWLRVDPADRAAYVGDCLPVVHGARVAPGCLDFALSADPVEPWRVNVAERWADEASLHAFRGSGPGEDLSARILDASVEEFVVDSSPDRG